MEKLADISAFESLAGNSSAVFNGAWNFHPVTVKDALWSCKQIRKCADILVSLLTVDGIEDKKQGLCLYQLDPATVLMVHETSKELKILVRDFCEEAVEAADASERKHYRNKIIEKYPEVDLSGIFSDFMGALAERQAEEDTRLEIFPIATANLPPELRRWRDYYKRLHRYND